MLTFLKITVIFCMVLLIVFLLMVMGFIPNRKIIEFLKNKPVTQAITGIAVMIGLCATFVIVLTA